MAFTSTGILNLADRILTYLVSAYLFIVILFLPFDAYEFMANPDDYKIGQHDNNSTNLPYLAVTGLMFIGSLGALILIIFSHSHPSNSRLKVIRRVAMTGILAVLIYSYYQWSLTGFDH